MTFFSPGRPGGGVGVEKAEPVDEKVPVVRLVAEVPAVAVVGLSVGALRQHRMIAPFPDEAAYEPRVAGEEIPVVLEVARSVAHRMRVLAQNEGAPLVLVLQEPPDPLDRGVHPAVEIDEVRRLPDGLRSVVDPGVKDPLVVDEAARIALPRPLRHQTVVPSEPRLVAERPHHDTRMILVALHEKPHSVDEGLGVLPALRKHIDVARHRGTVAFEVGLVDDIEAELVAQLEKARVVRVVRGPHRIDVVTLHHQEVRAHVIERNRIAGKGVRFMAIHALALDRAAVEENRRVPDLYPPESYRGSSELALVFQHETIEARLFGRPELGPCDRKAEDPRPRKLARALLDDIPVGIAKDRAHRDRASRPREIDLAVDLAGGEVFLEPSADEIIADVCCAPRQEVDLAEDAGQAPLVLIFEIAPVTPLQNQDGDPIPSALQVAPDVELGGRMAHLAVTDETPVDPEVERGVHALEDEKVLLAVGAVEIEVAKVEPGGIFIRDEGGITRVGIGHVRVDRAVVSVHLPVRGDRNRRPHARVEVGGRALDIEGLHRLVVSKLPCPAKVQ